MDSLIALAIPGTLLALGLMVVLLAKITSWNFDRKYPSLSRHGRRALAEDRAKRSTIPVALVPWDIYQERQTSDLEGRTVSASLDRLGKKRAAYKAHSDSDAA